MPGVPSQGQLGACRRGGTEDRPALASGLDGGLPGAQETVVYRGARRWICAGAALAGAAFCCFGGHSGALRELEGWAPVTGLMDHAVTARVGRAANRQAAC